MSLDDVKHPSLTGLWRFAYERQLVHERKARGDDRPWTTDATLQTRWFGNVHRELDPGTKQLTSMLRDNESSPVSQKIVNCMVYRVFNNKTMWSRVGRWTTSPADLADMCRDVREYWSLGDPIFTRAWTLSPLTSYPGRDRLEKVEWGMSQWDVGEVARALRPPSDLVKVSKALSSQRLMGRFTAYQTALDLSYVFDVSRDEVPTYSNAGKKISAWELGGSAGALSLIGLVSLSEARDGMTESLTSCGLSWSDVAWSSRPAPDLADVENVLCEYAKYVKLRDGRGRSRSYDGRAP